MRRMKEREELVLLVALVRTYDHLLVESRVLTCTSANMANGEVTAART
jgi:hypothetical protein